jgi:hypothetical protein
MIQSMTVGHIIRVSEVLTGLSVVHPLDNLARSDSYERQENKEAL